MATSKGVIQGYTGVAAVDGKHQIIVEAQAHGTGSEQELLVPVVMAMKDVLADNSLITADAGYHSEENLKQLAAMQVEALIADNAMRSHVERFATRDRHKQAPDPLYDKSHTGKKATTYQPSDFTYNPEAGTFDTTRGSIASPCEEKPKSMRSGSSSAWSTTSRSSLITGMRSNEAKNNHLPRR